MFKVKWSAYLFTSFGELCITTLSDSHFYLVRMVSLQPFLSQFYLYCIN